MTDLLDFVSGFDGVALKPTELDIDTIDLAGVERTVVDYEGREHVPDSDVLAECARETELSVTTPVRVDGFDPVGDDRLLEGLPEGVGRVLVAGNPAYLTVRSSGVDARR